MLLHDVVTTSAAVAATRSRTAKTAALADLLQAADTEELRTVVHFASGSLRQRRTGIGWRSLGGPGPAADVPTLTVAEVDRVFEELSLLQGDGSRLARLELLQELLSRATDEEQRFLTGLLTGELRQGALEGVLVPAVADAFGVGLEAVRRAAMLAGSVATAAEAARAGGEPALAAIGLRVGRPVQPMLASSATGVGAAVASFPGQVAVEAKLDGIRIQVHRDGDAVAVFSRSLDDLTARLPEVVAAVAALNLHSCVLDGEALALDPSGRPRLFQETAARSASRAGADGLALTPFFFDLLHLDGEDLLDAPLAVRHAALAGVVPAGLAVDRLVTDDPDAAETFSERVLARGHEGVVVKALDAPYQAGRRGAAWVKVKPVHTLDLVVLAAEWGSGRRRGTLSNIHLGARDPSTGGWVMLGKTFKGMTDEMLAWQTERFLALESAREGHVVLVRPEQVVEIAFDGIQRSTRYPGGMALRFARVVGYRDDKPASEADTVADVRRLAGG
jgi:DNA ligase-1